jgi:nucleotide-binding universal stress UspA family protein
MSEIREVAVGFDDSARGGDALAFGESLVRALGARLRVVRFEHEAGAGSGASLRDEVRRLLSHPDLDPEVEVLEGSPASGLAALARPGEGRAIVLGSTHRAMLGRIHPGSVAERLLHGGSCPVAVATRGFAEARERFAAGESDLPPAGDEIRVIAVGFDGRPGGRSALALATDIGQSASATLRVIAVAGPERAVSPPLRDQLAAAVRDLPPSLRALPVFDTGVPAIELGERAQEGVDLLILGSRGEGRLDRIWLGGVSTELMRSAACPVVVVPPGWR